MTSTSKSPRTPLWTLHVAVFVSGLVLLMLEVLAVRLLSPYFGSTTYTVSGVLTVILTGLAIGYVGGGRLADRRPYHDVFFTVYAAGGAAVLIAALLNNLLLPRIGYRLPMHIGPVLSASLLFLIPSVLFGVLSPFAVRLAQADTETIGRVAGTVFFWSTAGNIVGGLATGFVLVPSLGIRTLVVGGGSVLLALGVAGLLWCRQATRAVVILLVGLAAMFGAMHRRARSQQLVLDVDGTYSRIGVVDQPLRGRPARYLYQNRAITGYMYLDGEDTAAEYAKYHQIHRLFGAAPRRALVIGGGMYDIPRSLLRTLPEAQVDVVEIEPKLLSVAQRLFRLPKSPRLNNFVGDGRRFLQTSGRYNMIVGDAFHSLHATPWHLVTVDFFQLVKQRLAPGGFLLVNFIGNPTRTAPPSALHAELRALTHAFEHHHVFAADGPTVDQTQNVMVVGCRDACPLTEQDFAKQPTEFLRNLASKRLRVPKRVLEQHPLMTDDFAPIASLH